jgi:hypothetical protein
MSDILWSVFFKKCKRGICRTQTWVTFVLEKNLFLKNYTLFLTNFVFEYTYCWVVEAADSLDNVRRSAKGFVAPPATKAVPLFLLAENPRVTAGRLLGKKSKEAGYIDKGG